MAKTSIQNGKLTRQVMAGGAAMLAAGAISVHNSPEALSAPATPGKNMSVKVIQGIGSLAEARMVFCGTPDSYDEDCDINAVFNMRRTETGKNQAWVNLRTPAGNLSMILRTVVVGAGATANRWEFASPHNNRLVYTAYTIIGTPDGHSLAFANKNIRTDTGRDLGMLGITTIEDVGGFVSEKPYNVIARPDSGLQGKYGNVLTHFPNAATAVADSLGARAVYGPEARPR